MKLRRYRSSDCETLAKIFYDTIHAVNIRDYSQQQVDAWATGTVDLERWDRTMSQRCTFIAVEGDNIIGFGDMDETGYLDRLFVHKDYQGQGVATAICDALESNVKSDRYHTQASITAKPFFEGRGYNVVKAQQIERRGVTLNNFVMEKKV